MTANMKGDQPSRQQRKSATRQALLRAAQDVLKAHGLTGTTTRAIAKQAGVASGTLFVHFADVNALVEALLDEHIAAALAQAYRTLPRNGDVVKRLLHVAGTLYASYLREPELAKAYLAASLFTPVAGELSVRLAAFQTWVIGEINAAVAARTIPDIDRQLAFAAFFSLYFGMLVAGLNGLLTRKQQLANLDGALRRLLQLEAA